MFATRECAYVAPVAFLEVSVKQTPSEKVGREGLTCRTVSTECYYSKCSSNYI